MRFPLEVFEAVRAVLPADKPVGVRSRRPTGSRAAGTRRHHRVRQELKARGCDCIDASSGGVSPQQKIPLSPGYQVPFAQRVKEVTGIKTRAVGLITEPEQAEEIVASGEADWSRWRAACSTTRAGPGTPPPSSAPGRGPAAILALAALDAKALFGATTFGAR